MTKTDLRRKLLARRDSLSFEKRVEHSIAIVDKLISTDEWHSSNSVMVYLSINSEVMTLPLLTKVIEFHKRLLIPKVSNGNIIPIEVVKKFRVASGFKNILEPSDGVEYKDDIDLVIVPVVGFNEKCFRIGYGGGYYDRFLKKGRIKYKIGIAYECQKIDNDFSEEHDVKLDVVITEIGFYKCY